MKHFIPIIIIALLGCSVGHEERQNDSSFDDTPIQVAVLENIVNSSRSRCKNRIESDIDTTTFYASLNFYSKRDTDKVWVTGSFHSPFFFHDSLHLGMDHFKGVLKNKTDYYLIYECLFDNHEGYEEVGKSRVLPKLLNKWKLKSPLENPEYYPKDMSGTYIDPFVFEYMIDSIGNSTLLWKGHL